MCHTDGTAGKFSAKLNATPEIPTPYAVRCRASIYPEIQYVKQWVLLVFLLPAVAITVMEPNRTLYSGYWRISNRLCKPEWTVWHSENLFSPPRWVPVMRRALRHRPPPLQQAPPAQRRRRQTWTCLERAAAPLKPRTRPRSHCPRTPSCRCTAPTACPNQLRQVRKSESTDLGLFVLVLSYLLRKNKSAAQAWGSLEWMWFNFSYILAAIWR